MINQASPEFLYSFHIILIRKFHMFIYKLFPIFPQKLHSDSRLAHSKAIFLSSLKLLTYLSVHGTLGYSVKFIKLKTWSVYAWNCLIIFLAGFTRAALYPLSVWKILKFFYTFKRLSPYVASFQYSNPLLKWCKISIPCEGIRKIK